MDVIEKINQTGHLGRDFLVWLWFKSEVNQGIIDLGDRGQAEVRFSGKITLESAVQEFLQGLD